MRGFEQLAQAIVFFGFFAWCARREFLRALDVRLRGTAITILHKNYAYLITEYEDFFKAKKLFNLYLNLRKGNGCFRRLREYFGPTLEIF